MSLSLTMIANSSVGLRSCRFADVATASAIRPHCDGVQAGVCQRIFSFTEQTVWARQVLAWTSPPGSASLSETETAGALGGEPAIANDGARLAKAVAVPKDKDSFRKESANTANPPFVENGADSRSTIRILGPSRLTRGVGSKGLIRTTSKARALSKKSSSPCGVNRNADYK